MPSQFPNAYSCTVTLGAASTAGEIMEFKLISQSLRIYNAGSVDLFIDMNGNAPSTGTSHVIASGDVLTESVLGIASLGLHTTSTGSGQRVSVLAMARV